MDFSKKGSLLGIDVDIRSEFFWACLADEYMKYITSHL